MAGLLRWKSSPKLPVACERATVNRVADNQYITVYRVHIKTVLFGQSF